MNKTIYIRDEDAQVWDKARELAGDKLSPTIVDGLKQYIAKREAEEAESKGFWRIEVSFNDSDEHGIPKVKAFTGKWIFPPQFPVKVESDEIEKPDYFYAVALTAKGSVVTYSWLSDQETSKYFERFRVFPSLERAAADNDLNLAIRETIKRIGVRVEELDI